MQDPNNGGEISTYGFELELDYRPIDKFRITLSGNYYKSIDADYPKIYPAFSPQFLGYLNLSYRYKTLTFALTNHYVTIVEPKYSHEPIDPTDINSNEIGRVGDAAPAYLNMGLNIRYHPKFIKGAYANLRVSNLLNQKMYYPVTDFNYWAAKGTLGISRTLLLSVGYEF